MKQSQNIIQKRRHQLLEMLYLQDFVQVVTASKILNVSELTIRRDFDLLEQKGYITRFHGGAKLVPNSIEKTPIFESKGNMNLLQKQKIAQYIPQFIQSKDTVFLNGGTTTLEIIHCIKNLNITIITNNAMACFALADGKADFISTGGEYNKRNKSYTGTLAANLISNIYPTICILGVNGITADDGITTSAYSETLINKEALQRCRGKKIVVADSSKIGKTFCFSSADIKDIDILITDSDANSKELKKIKEQGVQIILAD